MQLEQLWIALIPGLFVVSKLLELTLGDLLSTTPKLGKVRLSMVLLPIWIFLANGISVALWFVALSWLH